MDGTSFDIQLQNLFPGSSREDWSKIAARETGSEDPFEKLMWESVSGIPFLPYYDAADESELQFVRRFALHRKVSSGWLNAPVVHSTDQMEANRLSLDHLLHGADGVLFDTRGVNIQDVNPMTREIKWNHCYLGFYLDGSTSLLPSLREHIRAYSGKALEGTMFWRDLDNTHDLSFFLQLPVPFRALGLLISESTPAHEVSDALWAGVRAFEQFCNQEDKERVFGSVAFSLPANARLLENVAKFKALRILWFQVARAYGLRKYESRELFLHARSSFVPDGDFGPRENMLKGTFAAMGALMGGCDALTVESDGTASFARRCARNVSTILREESFLDRDMDPLKGAWAVDAMTHAIAKEGWKLFQQKSHA